MTGLSHASAHPFAHLLQSYIAGSVEVEQLDALCDLMEDSEATADERLAFARYFLDAREDVNLPQVGEFVEITGAARA